MIKIQKTHSAIRREPLSTPFGFKGRVFSEFWHAVVGLTDDAGRRSVGVSNQCPFWSDAAVVERGFAEDGNLVMFQLTEYALRRCEGRSFATPGELFDEIFPDVLAHGREITGCPHLRPTFALNALVPVDNAVWQLYAAAKGCATFDAMLAEAGVPALPCRHRQVAHVPALSYGTTPAHARELAAAGDFVLKIKLGSDPDRDGYPAKMLAWDCERMTQLHAALRDCATDRTSHGRLAYYVDFNGRYDSLDRVRRFLDHCGRIGALSQILVLEEPFPEEHTADVRDLPVMVAADESAHSVADVATRMAAGYRAIALKAVAKTLTVTLRMAAAARAAGVPCFCADLAANPVLVDWGKNVAARLDAFPGLGINMLESNGRHHYRNWEQMKSRHGEPGAGWLDSRRGVFELDDRFYATAGGILQPNPFYASLLSW